MVGVSRGQDSFFPFLIFVPTLRGKTPRTSARMHCILSTLAPTPTAPQSPLLKASTRPGINIVITSLQRSQTEGL